MNDRATSARRSWWKERHRTDINSMVTSMVRFSIAELRLAKLPVPPADDMRKRIQNRLNTLRQGGRLIRSEDQVTLFVTSAQHELYLARFAQNDPRQAAAGVAQRTQMASAEWRRNSPGYVSTAEDPVKELEAQQIIETLVERLLSRPGLQALNELTQSLHALHGTTGISLENAELLSVDYDTQTVTLAIKDPDELYNLVRDHSANSNQPLLLSRDDIPDFG
jgi:hypothetical protein